MSQNNTSGRLVDDEVVVRIAESMAPRGWPRPVKYWRELASEALGVESIDDHRWAAIVTKGERHGLFRQVREGDGADAFDVLDVIDDWSDA